MFNDSYLHETKVKKQQKNTKGFDEKLYCYNSYVGKSSSVSVFCRMWKIDCNHDGLSLIFMI